MDPLTLFALANGAVSAVKAGCKLYKDIKSAAGDVQGVIKDLDDQFKKLHPPEKPPTVEQKNQFIRQKNEVIELNKKAEEGAYTGVYQEIGEHLGVYYDNLHKCLAVFEEEERRSRTEVYHGDASLGKRALQRVLMRKQLEQMGAELRELMIYQCPSELGALYTEVEEMMERLGKEQSVVIAKQIRIDRDNAAKRAKKLAEMKIKVGWAIGVLIVVIFYIVLIFVVVENRKKEYPELGQNFLPQKVANYDLILAERNKEYWAKQAKEYRERRAMENTR
jgi:hypothetical protein